MLKPLPIEYYGTFYYVCPNCNNYVTEEQNKCGFCKANITKFKIAKEHKQINQKEYEFDRSNYYKIIVELQEKYYVKNSTIASILGIDRQYLQDIKDRITLPTYEVINDFEVYRNFIEKER